MHAPDPAPVTRPRVALSPRVASDLRALSTRRSPLETGGILLGRRAARGVATITGYVELPNVDPRERRYAADPIVVRQWLRNSGVAGGEVVGFFHSHPETAAFPSGIDRSTMGAGWMHVLIGAEGEIRAYSRRSPDGPLTEAGVSDARRRGKRSRGRAQ